jgi:ATP-dependent exoDNAse (exonuclease V) beta subunit
MSETQYCQRCLGVIDVRELDKAVSDQFVYRKRAAGGGEIAVNTVHKAKGLEWPQVLMSSAGDYGGCRS